MNNTCLLLVAVALLSGCATNSDRRLTNPRQPGPAIGQAVGSVTGVVTGNVAGAAVGLKEGFDAGVALPFKNDKRVVRTWRTEQTADGRTIQVPVEVEVDEQGRPITPAQTK